MGELIEIYPQREPPEPLPIPVICKIYGGLMFPNQEAIRAMAYQLLELLEEE